MDPNQTSIDRFVAYVQGRGIDQRFEPLYRAVAQDLLRRFRMTSLDMLSTTHVKQFLEEEERRFKNQQIVCVALDAFYRDAAQRAPARPAAPPAEPALAVELPAPSKSSAGQPGPARPSAAYTTVGAREQRQYVRVPFVTSVAVAGSIGPRASADLSVGGMYIEMDAYTPIGTVLQVSFKLGRGDPDIELDARVVHEDPGGGVGLCFIDPSPEVRGRIQRYVEGVVLAQAQR